MPTNYAIMRCKKLKTMGSIASAMQHNFRERETLNADAMLTENNIHLAAKNTDEAMGALRENLPEKVRANGVRCVEYMMTASPEWWETAEPEERKQFFTSSLAWLRDKYGERNVIAASIHLDETTPHLSAFVTPITRDGRLCARDFIGGRDKLSDDQSTYAKKIQEDGLKLERGIKNSKAKHVTIRQYYQSVHRGENFADAVKNYSERIDATPKIKEKGLFKTIREEPHEVSVRIGKELKPVFTLASQKAKEFGMEPILSRRQKELEATEKYYKNKVRTLENVFSGMTLGQVEKIEKSLKEIKQFNKTTNNLPRDERKNLEQKNYPVTDLSSAGQMIKELGLNTPHSYWSMEKQKMEQSIKKQQKIKRGGGMGYKMKISRWDD
ncbi:plasmid recombination protein [Salmonella enterica]|nr:plasmid recombination protein [Salmonella enterica]